MDLTGRKILVTGADGFIGSHLTEMLASQGRQVRAMVQYNSLGSHGWLDTTAPQLKKEIDCVAGDIRDPDFVRDAVRGCDVVLHLAALIAIPYSYKSPAAYVQTNVVGTLNVLQACRDLNVSRLVQTSTSEVYGTARQVPINEEHPLQGQSPYAASKIGADQLALSFQRSFGTPVAVLRPFNTFGPRQSARAVIPSIITQIAAGITELKLGSLHPTRDFSYVEDTARGFIACAEADAAIGEVVNLGSHFEISIGDTAAAIAEVMGVDIRISEDASRLRPAASEVERLFADNRKALRLLGWSPRYAGLAGFKEALRPTIDWFRQPANLARYRCGEYTT